MIVRQVPASIGQRLLWFLNRYRGARGALNCPVLCRIRGPLELATLSAAIDHVLLRHESLRTTFAGRGRNLTQLIHEPAPSCITTLDVRPGNPLEAAVSAELGTPVDPQQSAVRITLWRVTEDDHVLCMNMHHLVTDTWSCAVLFRELVQAYAGTLAGSPKLPPVGWQYAHFTRWQERHLRSEEFQRHEEYWRRQLRGVEAPRLPLSRLPIGECPERASEASEIDPVTGTRLRELARSNRTTVFAVMLSVWYAVLHWTTDQDDLAVASVFANRTRPELERTVGFIANLLVLRAQLPPDPTFTEVLQASRRTVIDAFAHQGLPFHLLPESGTRSASGRVDDVVFQMLAEPLDITLRAEDVEFEGMAPDVVGRFDVELALMPRHQGFAVKLSYSPERLEPATASRLICAYRSLASAVAEAPDVPLAALAPGA